MGQEKSIHELEGLQTKLHCSEGNNSSVFIVCEVEQLGSRLASQERCVPPPTDSQLLADV